MDINQRLESRTDTLKNVFYSFLFSIYFYLNFYCRKFNAEFNMLIKAVGHCACFFKKMILNTPTFTNNFDIIWIFSYSHLSKLKQNTDKNIKNKYVT